MCIMMPLSVEGAQRTSCRFSKNVIKVLKTSQFCCSVLCRSVAQGGRGHSESKFVGLLQQVHRVCGATDTALPADLRRHELASRHCEAHNCLFACLTPQQHASVSQARICSDKNFTCCHTETEVADQPVHLIQSQYTDTGPTSVALSARTHTVF